MADINSFIIYGHTGVGKTFVTAQIMSDALWLVTRKSNLGGYNTWLKAEPEEAKRLGLQPIRSVIQVPRMAADPETGELVMNDVRQFIKEVVSSYIMKVQKGEARSRGIVFDELSVLARWAFEAIKLEEKNGFEVIAQIKNWVAELCEISAVTELPMAFICHTKDPAYHEEGLKKGTLKYKGGPAMPVGTMIAEVCALPDAVLQVDVERSGVNAVKRVIRTEASPTMERKCRVWGVDPVIEPDLRPLMTKAGWSFEANTNNN